MIRLQSLHIQYRPLHGAEASAQRLRWAKQAQIFVQPIVAAEDKHQITRMMELVPDDLQHLKEVNWEHIDWSDVEYFNLGVTKILRAAEAAWKERQVSLADLRRTRSEAVSVSKPPASPLARHSTTPTPQPSHNLCVGESVDGQPAMEVKPEPEPEPEELPEGVPPVIQPEPEPQPFVVCERCGTGAPCRCGAYL